MLNSISSTSLPFYYEHAGICSTRIWLKFDSTPWAQILVVSVNNTVCLNVHIGVASSCLGWKLNQLHLVQSVQSQSLTARETTVHLMVFIICTGGSVACWSTMDLGLSLNLSLGQSLESKIWFKSCSAFSSLSNCGKVVSLFWASFS